MLRKISILTTLALLCFSLGIQTSVSIPAGMHIFGFLAGAIYLFRDKRFIKLMPLSFWALACFIAVFISSALLNIDHLQEMGKSIGSIKYWLFALFFIIPLYQWGRENNERKIKYLLNLLMISIILAAIVGIIRSELQMNPFTLEFRPYHPRAGGFYGYMRYAYNLQFLLVLMLGMLLYKKDFNKYLNFPILMTAYVCGWLGLIMSETRGALLGVIAGSVSMIFLKSRKIGMLIGAVAATGIVLSLLVILSGGSERFRLLEKYNSSSNTVRLSQFESALYGFREKPILGLGPSQLRFNIERIKQTYDLPHKEYTGQHAHNVFLEILADFGALGLITFLAWLFLWGKELLAVEDINRRLIFPCLITLLVSGQVEYLFNSTGSFTIFLLYSISVAYYLRGKINESRPTP